MIVFLSVTTGIIIGMNIHGDAMWGFLPAGFAIVLYFLLLTISRSPLKAYSFRRFHYLWVILLFVGIGMLAEGIARPDEIKEPLGEDARFLAEVEEVSHKARGDRLIVKVDSVVDPTTMLIYTYPQLRAILSTDGTMLVPGDRILVVAPLQPVRDNLNMRHKVFATGMRDKGIYYQVFTPSENIHLLSQKKGLRYLAYHCREFIEILIEHTHLSAATKSFLITILLGDKDYLNEDMRELMADAGVSHMIAVSGLHMGIVAAIVLGIFFPLNFWGLQRWRYLLAIPCICAFALLSGFSASTVRASLMITFAYMAIFAQRRNHVGDTLVWSVVLILLCSPLTLKDIGFQLSVICVASLITFVDVLNTIEHRKHPRLYKLQSSLLVTLVSTFASWTLVSYSFGKIPLLFLPANMLVLPLLPLYFGISWLYILMSAIGFEVELLRYAVDAYYEFTTRLLMDMSGGGVASVDFRIGGWSVVIWCMMLILMGVGVLCRKNKKIFRASVAGGSLIFIIFVVSMPIFADNDDKAGFIITDNYRAISLLAYGGEEEQEVTFPVQTIASVEHCGKRVMSLDCPTIDSLQQYNPHIVVIGSGCKLPPGELRNLHVRLSSGGGSPEVYVIHPSVRKIKEQSYLDTLKAMGVKGHSLRKDGPYRFVSNAVRP